MPKHTPLTTPRDMINKAALPGLAAATYTHHSAAQMHSFETQAPPPIAAVLPSLLKNHLTSLPLCSYNRGYPDNRLDSEVFQILFQRRLRLPLPLPTTPCIHCKKPFDPYGDHLSRCKYSKKIFSNNIRGAIYTLCVNLAPTAEFVHTKHAVSCETGNLLPYFPGKQPADIGLCIRQSALSSTPTHPVDFLAIDITITPPPALPATDESSTARHGLP